MKQLRSDMLRQFDSLHGAFAVLARLTPSDKALGPKELRASLALIAPATSDAFFKTVGTAWPGAVSLAQLFRVLMDMGACPEAFLWELRGRLMEVGIWPNYVDTARALTRRLLETGSLEQSPQDPLERLLSTSRSLASDLALERTPGALLHRGREASAGTATPGLPAPNEESDLLNRQDWLKLCSLLGLTLFEARRLLKILGSEAGVVSLQRTFKLLRGLVTPDYSLTTFVSKVLEQYETLGHSFRDATLCRNQSPVMLLRDFSRLASGFGVGGKEALDLWVALLTVAEGKSRVPEGTMKDSRLGSQASTSSTASGVAEAQEAVRLSEQDFVRLMLDWAPDDTMNSLKGQLCELFGSLTEGRRALIGHGLSGRAALTPRCFAAGLRAAGVASCNAEVVLHRVRNLLNRPFYYQVTLDDVIEKMRSSHASAGTAHDIVEGDILHVWQQLRAVKATMRQSADGGDSARASSKGSSCAASQQPSTPSTCDGSERPSLCEESFSLAPKRWTDLLRTSGGGRSLCRPASACSSRSSSLAGSEASLATHGSELRRPPEDLARFQRRSRSKAP